MATDMYIHITKLQDEIERLHRRDKNHTEIFLKILREYKNQNNDLREAIEKTLSLRDMKFPLNTFLVRALENNRED
jgi:hypothetical protein